MDKNTSHRGYMKTSRYVVENIRALEGVFQTSMIKLRMMGNAGNSVLKSAKEEIEIFVNCSDDDSGHETINTIDFRQVSR
ncbi:unnamed protein product [Arabidopsis lyrata]|nr:unnamed protein product [Arabidopsis lyrata]